MICITHSNTWLQLNAWLHRHARLLLAGPAIVACFGTALAQSPNQSPQASVQPGMLSPSPIGLKPGNPDAASIATPGNERKNASSASAAAHLLALARRDLAHPATDVAQRTLEQLIARYPDSSSTPQARQLLFSIYARTGIGGSDKHKTASVPASRSPSAGLPQHAPSAGNWRTAVVAIATLREDFRNANGDRVFFAAGSSRLGARARAVLANHAHWLKQRPDIGLLIEGHADDQSAGANDEILSAARANAVRERLIEEGIEPARLATQALGARARIAICSTSDCAAQNRRAVVVPDLARHLMNQNSPVQRAAIAPSPDRNTAAVR